MASTPSVEEQIVQTIDKEGEIADSGEWASKRSIAHNDALVGAIKSLEALSLIVTSKVEKTSTTLTAEGNAILKDGSPEFRLWSAIEKPTSKSQLESSLGADVFQVGQSQAMKFKWLAFDKATNTFSRKEHKVTDQLRHQLSEFSKGHKVDDANLNTLTHRKWISTGKSTTFKITKGPSFSLKWTKPVAELTTEMLANGSWQTAAYKPLNLKSLGVPPEGGYLHPLLKVRAEFREIFLELGFEEMPTQGFVESSFWNFDALFQPQQHPARDAHDTFFLTSPASTQYVPDDYMNRVKSIHEKGGSGSAGYRYDWKVEETRKNILRTHTTSVSSRMLYKLAQEGFQPKKYFSIDRVFRNEAMDATHLAEFHQIEGLVADYNLSLGHLMGIIAAFYERLGIPKSNLRFKPAYNPYTEPSMEIFSYHSGLKKWVEIGNSGVFRPEMLLPMGLPPNVSVIAWGLSLERPTMIRYGINNIRDLVGHKLNLDFVANNPICRLDK